MMSLSSVTNSKKEKDLVSTEVFVNIDNSTVNATSTKYQTGLVSKREVAVNDDIGVMRLTLWSNSIDLIKESGTYIIENVTLKEYHSSLILSSIAKTVVKLSECNIASTNILLPELKTSLVKLPPQSIAVRKHYVCPTCKKYSPNDMSKIYRCSQWSNMVSIAVTKHYVCPTCKKYSANDMSKIYRCS